MKNTAAIGLILFGVSALWLYNSGRAAAILSVIKDPNYLPPSSGTKQMALLAALRGYGQGGSGGGGREPGGVDPQEVAACYQAWQSGAPDWACLEDTWKGLNSWEDIKDTLNDSIFSHIGIKL